MADFRTAWSPDTAPSAADWVMAPPGLAADRDLETAVLIALFTDATARDDDVIPDGTDDRRGWWGDRGPVGVQREPPEGPLGSRLWLLSREKATEETRRRAEGYAAEALVWVTEDGVAARVDVAATWLGAGPPHALGLRVRLLRADGSIRYDRRYAWAWEQLLLAPASAALPPPAPGVLAAGRVA
jgi:phage gp46-like protein